MDSQEITVDLFREGSAIRTSVSLQMKRTGR